MQCRKKAHPPAHEADGAHGSAPEAKKSVPNPEHKRCPYLLRCLGITRSNQVWRVDITYIPMRKSFLYMVATMDRHSRNVPAWRLPNTMETDFCVSTLEEALAKYGRPDIFNTDQGSQFTSNE